MRPLSKVFRAVDPPPMGGPNLNSAPMSDDSNWELDCMPYPLPQMTQIELGLLNLLRSAILNHRAAWHRKGMVASARSFGLGIVVYHS